MSASRPPALQPLASTASSAELQRLGARLFTIGHSNHELGRLLELLRQAGVGAVSDVRSSPFSQRLPQFNQPELRRELQTHGIGYVFLGEELGGRPRDPNVYDDQGRVDYWRVRQTAKFRAGLERLCRGLEKRTIAMMCSEEDPLDCHRGLMISVELVEHGVCPRHIRGNGSLETTPQLEARLFEATGVGGGMLTGLFAASVTANERAELLAEAYRFQAHRRAFRLSAGEDFAAIGSTEEHPAE